MSDLRRILYVEDDDDIREVAVMTMELVGGFEVRACASGGAAAAQAEFAPDLLLLDVMMPDMDGPATLAHLRQLPPFADVPAVFFTAKVNPEEIARLLALGAIAVVAKPFDPQGLPDQLRTAWNRRVG